MDRIVLGDRPGGGHEAGWVMASSLVTDDEEHTGDTFEIRRTVRQWCSGQDGK